MPAARRRGQESSSQQQLQGTGSVVVSVSSEHPSPTHGTWRMHGELKLIAASSYFDAPFCEGVAENKPKSSGHESIVDIAADW
jgi:hypothetical protein